MGDTGFLADRLQQRPTTTAINRATADGTGSVALKAAPGAGMHYIVCGWLVNPDADTVIELLSATTVKIDNLSMVARSAFGEAYREGSFCFVCGSNEAINMSSTVACNIGGYFKTWVEGD